MKRLQKITMVLGCMLALGSVVLDSGAEAGAHHAGGHRAVCEANAAGEDEARPAACGQAYRDRGVLVQFNCRPQRGGWEAFTIDQDKMRAPSMLRLYGTITEIKDDRITIRGTEQESVVALVNKNKKIIKGAKGKLRSAKELKLGQKVTVYYSARMTRSLPPQAQAFALVIGDVHKEQVPQYFVVDQVQKAADGSCIRVLNSTNDVIARIDEHAC